MDAKPLDLYYYCFVIDERPLCIWDTQLKEKTTEFLDSIDPEYFEYISNTNFQIITSSSDMRDKNAQYAALTLRAVYSQALETLFALIFSTLQAPQCIPAWILNYENRDLYSLVRKVDSHNSILSQMNKKISSWENISDILLEELVLDDKEKEKNIKLGFAKLWSRFATEFLSSDFNKEYNSIKHSMRIKPGGFTIAIGSEDQPGIPAPQEKMKVIGKSEFGSAYFISEKIGEPSHHIRMKHQYRNWSPEDIDWGLKLVSLSITNIKSVIRAFNGTHPQDVHFSWPSDLSVFDEPLQRTRKIGAISMTGFDIEVPFELIKPYSKDTILEKYRDRKPLGVIRYKQT